MKLLEIFIKIIRFPFALCIVILGMIIFLFFGEEFSSEKAAKFLWK